MEKDINIKGHIRKTKKGAFFVKNYTRKEDVKNNNLSKKLLIGGAALGGLTLVGLGGAKVLKSLKANRIKSPYANASPRVIDIDFGDDVVENVVTNSLNKNSKINPVITKSSTLPSVKNTAVPETKLSIKQQDSLIGLSDFEPKIKANSAIPTAPATKLSKKLNKQEKKQILKTLPAGQDGTESLEVLYPSAINRQKIISNRFTGRDEVATPEFDRLIGERFNMLSKAKQYGVDLNDLPNYSTSDSKQYLRPDFLDRLSDKFGLPTTLEQTVKKGRKQIKQIVPLDEETKHKNLWEIFKKLDEYNTNPQVKRRIDQRRAYAKKAKGKDPLPTLSNTLDDYGYYKQLGDFAEFNKVNNYYRYTELSDVNFNYI